MRLIAVLESLDNGKSIRETRDADVQIVARHLYHHAGWAQLMETEMKGLLFFSGPPAHCVAKTKFQTYGHQTSKAR